MVPMLLEDCWALMKRALRQFDALNQEVAIFLQDQASRLIVEDDPQTGKKTVYVADEPSLPRDWGIDLGQLTNNARTALDHLVYALAIEAGGQPSKDRTMFPIFTSRDAYWQTRGKGTRQQTVRDQYLAGVDECWRKKIDAVQPYRNRTNSHADPLVVLADISNGHKHQTLKAARLTIETPAHRAIVFGGLSGIRVCFDPRRDDDVSVETQVKGGKTLTPPAMMLQPKVPVDNRTQLDLVFGQPPSIIKEGVQMPAGFYNLTEVRRSVQWSASILRWFEPAFSPNI
jgi:hypothetical protein